VDQPDDTGGQKNGSEMGKGEVGKLHLGAGSEKIVEELPHNSVTS
jgi:hypothetical protein